jgi:hypothetical protein
MSQFLANPSTKELNLKPTSPRDHLGRPYCLRANTLRLTAHFWELIILSTRECSLLGKEETCTVAILLLIGS